MIVKRAIKTGAVISTALLLALAALSLSSFGSPAASAAPLACSPSSATHTFTANDQVWNMNFVKAANGCQSIWLVANATAPFQYYEYNNDGGAPLEPTQTDCGGNTVCQLYDPAANGDAIGSLELLANAPVTVTVYY